jgi:hypothetical protein
MKRAVVLLGAAAMLAVRSAAAQRADTLSPPQADTAAAAADSVAASDPRWPRASPPLPFEHWAVRAAWRAEALGLAPFLPAERSVPRTQVAQALFAAQRDAPPALRALAEGWVARFVEEFPEYAPGAAGAVRPLGVALSAGYQRDQGRLAPDLRYSTEPQPLPDVSAPRAALRAGVASRALSVELEGVLRGGQAVLRAAELGLAAGAWQLSLGREPVGYGMGRTGGIVFSDPDPLPRFELQTVHPLRLPGLLRRLGPTTLDLFAGPVDDPERHPTGPALLGMRVAIQPHPRLTLGANRGSMFGGDSARSNPLRFLRMLAGVVHSSYENQVISLDARWRLPSERVLPATAYVEWGADDAAGAMDEEPARVMGIFLPALPGLPQAALGAEYTYFKHACCGHGPWYFNATLQGHWVVHEVPLGHPLGGEGAEYALYAQGEAFASRLRLDARLYRADRSERSRDVFGGANLYAPARTGRALGGRLDASWRLARHFDAHARFARESGAGWREQHLETLITWLH